MPQHVGIDGVDPGDFHIESVRGRMDYKPDPPDLHLPFPDHMGDGMNAAVKRIPKRRGKLADERLAAAVLCVPHGVRSGIFGRAWQEGRARRVIGRQHPGNLPACKIAVQRGDAVDKAGGFQHDKPAVLFQQEHLVRQRVAGLIGVQLHVAEIVHMHFALAQPDSCKIALVHGKYLQNGLLPAGLSPSGGFIIAGRRGLVKYAQYCGIDTIG